MKHCRRCFKLAGFIVCCLAVLTGGACAYGVLSLVKQDWRRAFFVHATQVWARLLLALLGVRVNLVGQLAPAPLARCLIVANHQSYLDILICAAHFPSIFVAKHELRNWPLLGWLAALGGTFFLDRTSTHSSVRCAFRTSRALRSGACVQVFPEGSTTNGASVHQFNSLFFAAAQRAHAAILPLTITLQSVNGTAADTAARAFFCWVGDAEFLPHFWQLLALDQMEVTLTVHEALLPAPQQTATLLAQIAQQQILAGFGATAVKAASVIRVGDQYPEPYSA